jgi:lysophospholipase L1-like esterase
MKESHIASPHTATGLTLAVIWAYVSVVFLAGESGLPIDFGLGAWLLSIIVVLFAGKLLATWLAGRKFLSDDQISNATLLGGMSIICLLILDVAYTIYLNSTISDPDPMKSRVFDRTVWVSELYPKVYYPTERNFALHKPGVMVSGELYGNFYSEPMRHSPTLVDSVLEKHPITIQINELGFRESSDLEEAEIFTLGDSFTFGWGVNADQSWPGLLERQLNEPVYNLAIHDASPKQELELLRYMLQEHDDKMRIRRLLWMIYEGNDLEDDYSETVQRHDTAAPVSLVKGTLIEAIEQLMWTIKRQSVIDKLRHGRIRWKTSSPAAEASPYLVDDVPLVYPYFVSQQLGARLFYQTYVDLAGESADYVNNHWNRAALEQVFEDMKSLAAQHDFKVTVVIAPGASRLHGPYFDNFPEISSKPHFIDFVANLTDRAGFDVVNLYTLMAPLANTELFFFRDDDHFSHRGNELAAQLIHQEVFAEPGQE